MIKVGDLVRVITDKPRYKWGRARKFDVGEVTHINHDDLRIDFPNHKDWHGLISEVELVTNKTRKAQKSMRTSWSSLNFSIQSQVLPSNADT